MREENVTGLVRVLIFNPQTHFSGRWGGRGHGALTPGGGGGHLALPCLRRMALCFPQPSNPRTWTSTAAASAAPPVRTG